MRRSLLCLSVLLAVLSPSGARADDPVAARDHFEKGTTLYDLGRFSDAVKEYELAYENVHDPALLFNIAQANRFAGDYAKAIFAFRSYLRRLPKAGNRAEVEARINEMQKMLDDQKRQVDRPPGGIIVPAPSSTPPSVTRPMVTTPPVVATTTRPRTEPPARPPIVEPVPPPPETTTTTTSTPATPPPATTVTASSDSHPGRTLKIVGLSTAGVGVVLIVVGGAFAAIASSAHDVFAHPKPGYTFNPADESAIKTDQSIEVAMLVVGGLALAAGVTVAVLGFRASGRERRVSLAPALQPGGAGLVLVGRF